MTSLFYGGMGLPKGIFKKANKEGSMMRTRHFICSGALIAFVAFWVACGSSSDSAVAGGATDSTDPVSLNTVDAVSADLSTLDLSQSASANVAVGQAMKAISKVVDAKIGSTVGDESMAGCQLASMKDEALRISKQARIFQCYLGKMQENYPASSIGVGKTPSSDPAFVIPDGSYAYYSITMPGMEDAGDTASYTQLIRVGKNVIAANTLSVQMCEGSSQIESFIMSSDAATRAIRLDMKHHFSFTPEAAMNIAKEEGEEGMGVVDDGDGEYSDGERGDARELGIVDEWGQFTGDIVADAAATGRIDTLAEIDSAAIDARFSGMWGDGSMGFNYYESGSPSDGAYVKIEGHHSGSFGDSNSFAGGHYGMFDTTQGRAKYSFSGTFPAMSGTIFGGWNKVSAGKYYCPIEECDWEARREEAACLADWALDCSCMEESATGGTATTCIFTDSGTEHFIVRADDDDTDTKPEFYIAGSSAYQALVDATLPTELNPLTKEFSGDQLWDCSGTAVAIDVSAKAATGAFDECIALEDEAFDRSESKESCMQEKQGDDQENTKELLD